MNTPPTTWPLVYHLHCQLAGSLLPPIVSPALLCNSEICKQAQSVSKREKKKIMQNYEWENNPLIHVCSSFRGECCSVLTLWSLHEVDDFSSQLMKCNKELMFHFRTSISHILVKATIGQWISLRTPRRRRTHECAAGTVSWKLFPWRHPCLQSLLVSYTEGEKKKKANGIEQLWGLSWGLVVNMFPV